MNGDIYRGRKTKTLQKWEEIIVVNGENLSPEQELVQDLIAIVTVFSAHLHGLRSYQKAMKEAALRTEEND